MKELLEILYLSTNTFSKNECYKSHAKLKSLVHSFAVGFCSFRKYVHIKQQNIFIYIPLKDMQILNKV